MQDGRFNTLEEMIEHYIHGVISSTELDAVLKSKENSPFKLNLSSAEKQALKVFLLTLTDKEMLIAKRYSDPFSMR